MTATQNALGLLQEAQRATDAVLAQWADRLAASWAETAPAEGEAIRYALGTSGKRVRPALVHMAYAAVGGTHPRIDGVGAAVEIVHTYSLVHDDLPCMDDDDQRRGRPTVHRQFGVPVATRAGFRLVPVAVEVLAEAVRAMGLGPDALGRLAGELLRASGIRGMVGGQWRDLEAEGRSVDLPALREIHREKTGALIEASCVLGGMAGGAGPEDLAALRRFGAEIGVAFQVADDLLDVTGTSAELGKTAGRDGTLNKSTYVRLLGLDGARAEAARLEGSAVEALAPLGPRADPLIRLARYIVNRRS